jgi:hypothetical protein
VTDPQSRIAQLERGVRHWRRAALILSATLLLFVVGFGVLMIRADFEIERERARAEEAERAVAEHWRAANAAKAKALASAVALKSSLRGVRPDLMKTIEELLRDSRASPH